MAVRPSLHFIASSINIAKFPLSSISPSSTTLLLRHIASAAPPQQHHRKQKHKHKYPHQNPLRQLPTSLPLPPLPPSRSYSLRPKVSLQETLAQKIGKAIRRPGAPSKARVYTDVNVIRPKEYWDYESLTVQWGLVLSMASPVISMFYSFCCIISCDFDYLTGNRTIMRWWGRLGGGNTVRFLRDFIVLMTRSVLSKYSNLLRRRRLDNFLIVCLSFKFIYSSSTTACVIFTQ